MFFSIYDFLAYACLDFLIHAGVGEAEHEAVRPFFVDDSYFGNGSFVMISVIEPPDMYNVAFVNGIVATEVLYGSVYIIVVV